MPISEKLLNKLLTDKTCGVVFLSCLEKEKSIKEISEEWAYSPTFFYRQDTINTLLSLNLIKVTRIEKRESFFRSNLDVYWNIIGELVKLKKKKMISEVYGEMILLDLLKEKEKVIDISIKLMENQNLAKKLFNTKQVIKNFIKGKKRYIDPFSFWIIPVLIFLIINFTCVYFYSDLEKRDKISEKDFLKWKANYIESLPLTFSLLSIMPSIRKMGYGEFHGKMVGGYWRYLFDTLELNDITFLLNLYKNTKFFKKWYTILKDLKTLSKDLIQWIKKTDKKFLSVFSSFSEE